jgi:hypothetical protein
VNDPIGMLTIAVDEARAADAEPMFDALERYFDLIEDNQRGTPEPEPGIEMVGARLFKHFPDPRARIFLALLLMKFPDWPYWRRAGIILCLGRAADPATLPGLARLAVAESDPALRDLAREMLAAFPAEALCDALVAEARWWAEQVAR